MAAQQGTCGKFYCLIILSDKHIYTFTSTFAPNTTFNGSLSQNIKHRGALSLGLYVTYAIFRLNSINLITFFVCRAQIEGVRKRS